MGDEGIIFYCWTKQWYEFYTPELKRKIGKKLDFAFDGQHTQFFSFGGKFFIYYTSKHGEKKGPYYINLCEFDYTKGELIGEPIKITAGGLSNISISPDGSHIAFFTYSSLFKHKYTSFALKVLDKELNPVIEEKVEIDGKHEIVRGYVNNDGAFVGITKPANYAIDSPKKYANVVPLVISANPNGKGLNYTGMEIEDKLTIDIATEQDDQGIIYGLGRYSDKNKDKRGGFYFFKVRGENGKINELVFQPNTVEFWEGLIEDSKLEKMEQRNNLSFWVKNFKLHVLDDDKIVYIGERYRTMEGQQSVLNLAEDIFIFCFSKSGKLLWKQKIDKEHGAVQNNELFATSYFSFVENDKLWMAYNPDFRKDSKKPTTNLILTSVDCEGNLQTETLKIGSGSSFPQINVQFFEKSQPEELLLHCLTKSSKHKVGKLTW
ncbi:MAG: hypothetical protein AAF502_14535 [Bacteroidota bacterium]